MTTIKQGEFGPESSRKYSQLFLRRSHQNTVSDKIYLRKLAESTAEKKQDVISNNGNLYLGSFAIQNNSEEDSIDKT